MAPACSPGLSRAQSSPELSGALPGAPSLSPAFPASPGLPRAPLASPAPEKPEKREKKKRNSENLKIWRRCQLKERSALYLKSDRSESSRGFRENAWVTMGGTIANRVSDILWVAMCKSLHSHGDLHGHLRLSKTYRGATSGYVEGFRLPSKLSASCGGNAD